MLGLLIAVIQIGLIGMTQGPFLLMALKTSNSMLCCRCGCDRAAVVTFLTTSFIGPMYATGLTLFYYDQRIRKEGFDIEWMMQAAGLTVPATPVSATTVQPVPPQTEQGVEQPLPVKGTGFSPYISPEESARALAPEGSSSENPIPSNPLIPGNPNE